MAITEPSSSHTEWVQFYQRNLSHQPTGGGGGGGSGSSGGIILGHAPPMTESTVVTTTTTPPSPAGAGGDRAVQPPLTTVEGRVGKAARRRSRASRKAPTTVLNTDTTNFRAMVQQFTGVPTRSFQSPYPHMVADDGGGGGGPATLSFGHVGGGGSHLHHQQPSLFPFQQQQQQQQYQQYPPQFQQHHERQLFGVAGSAPGGSDAYLRGFGGNPHRESMERPEGLLLEGISSSQRMTRSSGSSTTDGFFL
uniref:VQ domain-containing protein n=1 Tax=Anthurium amnicola TaxID=1678845 RepID=A0A1D1Z1W4_9ARAE